MDQNIEKKFHDFEMEKNIEKKFWDFKSFFLFRLQILHKLNIFEKKFNFFENKIFFASFISVFFENLAFRNTTLKSTKIL